MSPSRSTKQTDADKAYLAWKKSEQDNTKHITLGKHEACLYIKKDASVEVYLDITQEILEPELLALGLSWALEDADWKQKLLRKAHAKLQAMLEKEGVAFTTTPSDTHEKNLV